MSNGRSLGALFCDILGSFSNFNYGALHRGGLPILNVGDSLRETLHSLSNRFQCVVNVVDHTALTAAMLVMVVFSLLIYSENDNCQSYLTTLVQLLLRQEKRPIGLDT